MPLTLGQELWLLLRRRDKWSVLWLCVLGLALGMLFYRFANLSLASFILDEPVKLATAQQQLTSGTWVSSDLVGTRGMPYGPVSLWFFRIAQQLLGPAPVRSIFALCFVVTLSQLALAWAIADLFEGKVPLFALLVAFVASSPYVFFWSRLAWEMGIMVLTAWTLVLLCWRGPLTILRTLLLGAVLGLLISSHLMSVPFVALAFGLVVAEQIRRPLIALRTTGLMLITMTLVNIPYLRVLASASRGESAAGAFTFLGTARNLLQSPRASTLWGIEYFFDAAWAEFKTRLGLLALAHQASEAWALAVAIVAALGLVAFAIRGSPPQRRVSLLVLGAWLGYAGFYSQIGLDLTHPHYQWPVWWVPMIGLGAAVAFAARKLRPAGIGLGLTFAAAAVAQFVFILAWVHYTDERTGTRGIHISTPVGEQVRAVRAVCAVPESSVALQNATGLFPESLRYILSVEPACAGKKVELCSGFCPPSGEGIRTRILSYAKVTGGALEVK